MTDQTATEATEATAWQQKVSDAIGPVMLLGLQDAELHDGPGRQRIQDWVGWISKTVVGVRDEELAQARAEVAAARQFAVNMREFCSPHGTPVRTASRSSRTRFDWSDLDTWDAALRDVAVVYVVPRACRARCTNSRYGPKPPACVSWSCSPGAARTPGATPRSGWTCGRPRTPCAARHWRGPSCGRRTSLRTSTRTSSTRRCSPGSWHFRPGRPSSRSLTSRTSPTSWSRC